MVDLNLARHEQQVLSRCVRMDGMWVRGQISKVICRACGKERWDDGKRCPLLLDNGVPCGAYQNVDSATGKRRRVL